MTGQKVLLRKLWKKCKIKISMKIAILSTPWIPLPPVGYGGTERVAYDLYTGLVAKGHEVFVFATGDSKIYKNLLYFYEQSVGVDALLDKSHVLTYLNHIYHALKNLPSGVDIIHNHCETAAMHLLDAQKIPFIHTLHNILPDSTNITHEDFGKKVKHETLTMFKKHSYVSISKHQRIFMPDLNYAATIYNGLSLKEFIFNEKQAGDYIFWLGRFSVQKGLKIAIQAALKTEKKLILAAKIHSNRINLFEQEIVPLIDEKLIFHIGEIKSQEEKNKLLSHARLFLFPIQWEEPFGLVMIESMACGTPVVAFARGSVPEVIKDGETGFIVNSSPDDIRGNWIVKKTGIEGLCEAVERIYSMPDEKYRQMRRSCRQHVEKNFTVEKMVDEYEKVYQQILSSKK